MCSLRYTPRGWPSGPTWTLVLKVRSCEGMRSTIDPATRSIPSSRAVWRAHSIAAQGGINAAKNYQNDGDSVYRLFYDTVKGGDFRAREANVYRLAQISVNIIDQCVAQGVPFARESGGGLTNRS